MAIDEGRDKVNMEMFEEIILIETATGGAIIWQDVEHFDQRYNNESFKILWRSNVNVIRLGEISTLW